MGIGRCPVSAVDFFAQPMAVPVWLVALVSVVLLAVRALDAWSSAKDSRAREAEAAVVALHASEITELHAEVKTLCDQARDHIAVLAAFREGYELFVPDTELDQAREMYAAATSAALAGFLADDPQTAARHATDTPTQALPQVPPAGDETSGQA